MCHSLIHETLLELANCFGERGRKQHSETRKYSLQAGNRKSTMRWAASYHCIIDYFPKTAPLKLFYSLLIQ